MKKSSHIIDEYLSRSDWRVSENSNNDYSYPSLRSHVANSMIANYTLDHLYTERIAAAHREAWLHIHDLGHGIAPYCMGYSLRDLLYEGFNGIKGRSSSAPPKRLRSACLQMANFIGTLQSYCAGAQAFNSVDTFLAPYIKHTGIDYAEIKQSMQELVHNLNTPSRSGEIPFSNFSFDLKCPDDLKDQHPVIGGKAVEFTYGDCNEEIDLINKAFVEVMTEGDRDGRMFSFPIPTYFVTEEFDWDSPTVDMIFELTGKYGTPYFSNFLNSDLDPSDIRSMCCRLSLDLTELRKSGSTFNSFDSTGSVGVVTLNMPRIGHISKTKEEFFTKLDEILNTAKDSLEIKRIELTHLWDRGLYPYLERWLPHKLERHFSTMGIVGMNECVANFFGGDQTIDKSTGKEFALEVLDHILSKIKEFQLETGNLYNLEETPAESCCYRFAMKDKERYKNVIHSGTKEAPYYTQGCKLPFGYSDNIFEVLNHQEALSTKYTGGSVGHVFLGESINGAMAKKIVKTVLTDYRMPYITLSPTFSICSKHGYIEGEVNECPECGAGVEVYSRVVGYYSPVYRWNDGKKSEWTDRKTYETSITPWDPSTQRTFTQT